MTLENLLTSGFTFKEEESLIKHRYKLVNSMFFAGAFIAALATLMRYLHGDYIVALADLVLSLTFFISIIYLRKSRSTFEIVTTIQLTFVFLLFTIVVLALPEKHIKLLWYALLISVSYMVKGIKGGIFTFAAIIFSLTFFYTLPQLFPAVASHINLHLTFSELIMAFLGYTTIAIFNTFETLEQQKSIENLKSANKKIQLQQEELYRQLRTYPLTNLPNARALQEALQKPLQKPLALITMSIDDYAILADEFGTEYAQKIILQSAKSLQRFTSDTIHLFHVAPYQFSFLLENVQEQETLSFAANLKNYFESIYITIDNIELSISFSMGIATENQEKLIVHADSALYEAQRNGINTYKLFHDNEKRTQEQRNNIYWNNKIKEIIHQNKLQVYYQPIIDNQTGTIHKYESLIRAIDGDKVISPFFFIQAAKTRGMLPSITKFVIEKSFEKFSKNHLEFSINITEDDLKDEYLVPLLRQKTKEYNINPKRVYLEVLENITSVQTETIQNQFQELKNLGFGIAIDDFGAEASNLSRLLTYNADIIKIDGMFIKNLDTDENSIKIVETIVSLAKKLEAKTVAEFVHSEAIYHIVTKLGVDYSQGYFFGAPQPQLLEEKELLPA